VQPLASRCKPPAPPTLAPPVLTVPPLPVSPPVEPLSRTTEPTSLLVLEQADATERTTSALKDRLDFRTMVISSTRLSVW